MLPWSQENHMPKEARPCSVFMAGVAQTSGQSSRLCGARVLVPAQAGDEGLKLEQTDRPFIPLTPNPSPREMEDQDRDARAQGSGHASFQGELTLTGKQGPDGFSWNFKELCMSSSVAFFPRPSPAATPKFTVHPQNKSVPKNTFIPALGDNWLVRLRVDTRPFSSLERKAGTSRICRS